MTAVSLPTAARADALTLLELVERTRETAEAVKAGRYPFITFDPDLRWHRRIYRDAQVDIWLITWLPTQGTQLHDHGGSAGSFTVVSGELAEATYVESGPHAGTLRERVHPAGRSVGFGAGYVHDVRNLSDAPAVSVHAYSAPLTSMTYWDVDETGLVQLATLDTDEPEPEAAL